MNIGITIKAVNIDVLIVVALEIKLMDNAISLNHQRATVRNLAA